MQRVSAQAIHDDFETLEWLETNGLGGFSSQTVNGMHTRRYHGLLVGSLKPPVDRVMLLSSLVETLKIGDEEFPLSCHLYKDAKQLEAMSYLSSFALDPFPVWTYEIEDVEIEKSLFMPRGHNTVVIQYRVLSNGSKKPLQLGLKPLFALRDLHTLRHDDARISLIPKEGKGFIEVTAPDMPSLFVYANAKETTAHEHWYKNFHLPEEQARGYDFTEDLFTTSEFHYDLTKKDSAFIVASLKKAAWTPTKISEAERERRQTSAHKTRNVFLAQLEDAAEQFVVERRPKGTSIIAGYHWFTDWGRDTMISIPGLLLTRGHEKQAKVIVETFLKHLSDGMIPNRFPEEGKDPEYNTVDATLWLFQAVRAIIDETKDLKWIKKIFPQLTSIIEHHEQGTRHNIRIDAEDGLLTQGEEGFALTWMDAVYDGNVVTPRRGKAVEINALWYNALVCMEEWSALLKNKTLSVSFREKADRVRSNFRAAFWNESKKSLFDCIAPDGTPSQEIRPNQIFAMSLRPDLLTKEQQRGVLQIVTDELLTPMGLRSLSPKDPQYHGTYIGNQKERDMAYHQGTVWGWLMGPYLDAFISVFGTTAAKMQLNPLRAHFTNAGIGQLSEIFDGNAPHTPRGCIAQAWTVAELLRVSKKL